jgi:hypothetical protein
MIDIFDPQQFIEQFLKISDKSGHLIPFKLNRAQRYILTKLQEQEAKTGKIRALILKGRQQGCSTLIQAVFFHRVLTRPGTQAFILTHLADATRNLFDITKRYDDNLPAGLAPKPSQKSHNRLTYDTPLESGYKVGTAGNPNLGRSMTTQLMHCSEYAFFEHMQEIKTGVLQTIADIDDTAIIKESTANGQENDFFFEWQAVNSDDYNGDYIIIFVPWFWQDEYKSHVDETFTITDDEQDLLNLYSDLGLTVEHLAWRRKKIAGFAGDYDQQCQQFNQEYPCSAQDAFISSNTNAFINADLVRKARNNSIDTDSSLIVGVDPAIKNTDRLAIAYRRGRKLERIDTFYNQDTMQIVGRVASIIKNERPQRVFIDSIGIGAGIVDRLKEMGHHCVVGVNVAERASESDRFINRRAELWEAMNEWLNNELGVDIPDMSELQIDLCSYTFKYRGSKLQIESKDDLKKRGGRSSDLADALALTFYLGQYINTNDNLYNPVPTGYNTSLC